MSEATSPPTNPALTNIERVDAGTHVIVNNRRKTLIVTDTDPDEGILELLGNGTHYRIVLDGEEPRIRTRGGHEDRVDAFHIVGDSDA